MLVIDREERDIPKVEYFDQATQEFITIPGRHANAIHLQLEHSLLSIRRWEAKWHEVFGAVGQMDEERFRDYVRCMTINPQKDPEVYRDLLPEDFVKIGEYIQDPMSAYDMSKKKKPKKKQKPEPAEAYYFAMTQLGIPFDCEKWHFNQLMALIDYCATNGSGGMAGSQGKPRSQREMMELYHALNQKNRKKYNSKG